MPGFYVSSAQEGGYGASIAVSTRQFYYNYSWEISNFFGEEVPRNDSMPIIYAKDATLPTFTAVVDSVQGASLQYKHAKHIVWDDVRITWYDSTNMLGLMQKWRRSVWDESSGLQPIDRYKKTSKLVNYLPTGLQPNSWELVNSWPSVIRHGDLTYTSSEVKLVSVTVSYDWARELPGFGSDITGGDLNPNPSVPQF